VVAGNHVPEKRAFPLDERLIETGRGAGRCPYRERLLEREARSLGCFGHGRFPSELQREHVLGPIELPLSLDHVHRHPDRPSFVGKPARHRLADPPGRVGRELVTPAPVEFVDRAHQAQRPLLNQVEEG